MKRHVLGSTKMAIKIRIRQLKAFAKHATGEDTADRMVVCETYEIRSIGFVRVGVLAVTTESV